MGIFRGMCHNKLRRDKGPCTYGQALTYLLSWLARSAPRSYTTLWEAEHVDVVEGLMRTPYIKKGSQEAKCPPQHTAYEHT